MSKRTVFDYEIACRQVLARAKDKLLEAIQKVPQELTAMEWLEVLNDIQGWLLSEDIAEEWRSDRL
jgi:hypothetical protein